MTMLPMEPAKKLGLVIDLDICVGCHACAVNCKEWNTGGYGNALSDQAPYGEDPAGNQKIPGWHRQKLQNPVQQ